MVWRNTHEIERNLPDVSIRVHRVDVNLFQIGALYHSSRIALVLEVNDSISLLRQSAPRLHFAESTTPPKRWCCGKQDQLVKPVIICHLELNGDVIRAMLIASRPKPCAFIWSAKKVRTCRTALFIESSTVAENERSLGTK